MASRRGRRTYSGEEVARLLLVQEDDSELEEGTSKEEEAELERQLGIFSEESSWTCVALLERYLESPVWSVIPVISMKQTV